MKWSYSLQTKYDRMLEVIMVVITAAFIGVVIGVIRRAPIGMVE